MITKTRLFLASFILGALVGSAGLNWVTGRHMDKAELEIRRLRSEVADHNEKIATLEKRLAIEQNFSVSEIQVYVNLDDEYEKLELETEVKRLLKDLRGKDLKDLDPVLVAGIVDKRIIDTGKHKFRLSVKGTLISEKIIMYIEVKEMKDIPINK